MGSLFGTPKLKVPLELLRIIGADGVAGGNGNEIIDLDNVIDAIEAFALHDTAKHSFRSVTIVMRRFAKGLIGLTRCRNMGILSYCLS